MYNAIYDTLNIAKKVVYLPSCHSTNDIAAELVRNGADAAAPDDPGLDGTVVITDEQTRGKGQRGNTWRTEAGKNITMSVILKPSFLLLREQFLISQCIAVGVCRFLRKYTSAAAIKWPNDVLLGEKKVCGMLIENAVQGQTISSSIAGIGLNICQMRFNGDRATSLNLFAGVDITVHEAFEGLVRCLDASYLKVRTTEGRHEIVREYESMLFGRNEQRRYRFEGAERTGQLLGVAPTGAMRMLFDGETAEREFMNKEIEWVWE